MIKAAGNFFRYDRNAALQILRQFGIDPATESGGFYLEYQGSFISPRPLAELLDIEGPAIPAIPDQTEYARDRYQLPLEYLALTSDESEGCISTIEKMGHCTISMLAIPKR